jgi:hypothetical protein
VKIEQVVKSRPLNSQYLDDNYPSTFTPFYLYGNKEEKNIDHMLLRAPNSQFSAEDVKLELDQHLSDEQLAAGPLLCLQSIYEEPSQPFPENDELQASSSFWFKPGQKLAVKIYRDTHEPTANGPGLASSCENQTNLLASGHMTLGSSVFVDSETMNEDPFKKPEKMAKWREEFDKIGKSMRKRI